MDFKRSRSSPLYLRGFSHVTSQVFWGEFEDAFSLSSIQWHLERNMWPRACRKSFWFLQLNTAWPERHSKRHACKKTTLYTRDLECKLYPLKLLWSFRHLFWRWNWSKYANLTPTLELDAEQNELRENPLLKNSQIGVGCKAVWIERKPPPQIWPGQESPQKERSRHMTTCRRKVEMVQVQSFVMDSGRDTLKKQFARRYTPANEVQSVQFRSALNTDFRTGRRASGWHLIHEVHGRVVHGSWSIQPCLGLCRLPSPIYWQGEVWALLAEWKR